MTTDSWWWNDFTAFWRRLGDQLYRYWWADFWVFWCALGQQYFADRYQPGESDEENEI